jgi:hypothetical protein
VKEEEEEKEEKKEQTNYRIGRGSRKQAQETHPYELLRGWQSAPPSVHSGANGNFQNNPLTNSLRIAQKTNSLFNIF